ncbi:MAG: hypothetical protein AMJ65_15195 [Phycisphaerae bacterium SG8_4]|nr:MAG: hypothetical protein AMJ65_15195 [Phycisphaerae bacterium SG8_4]
MNKRTVAGSWIVVGALCAGFAITDFVRGAESETITFESLLEEMVDRDLLSRLPVRRSVEDIIKPRFVKGASEGEKLPIVRRSGAVTEIQNIPRFRSSNNRQLWWRNAKEQDELVVEFTVEEVGDYDVTLGITKAVDYGIVRIEVNSQTMVDSLDLYNRTVVATKVKLGACRFGRRKNTLKVTILGANPSAAKSHMFGLDYILAHKR